MSILYLIGSHKGAEMSAIFNKLIETCKMNQRALSRSGKSNGILTIEYIKKLLSELLTSNNNYAGLLPQMIGIKR